jgi:1,4-alpha-glucan branching enzyme
VHFVFVAPDAKSVSVVGDFNDWKLDATPLTAARDRRGVWTVAVPLPPGRYTYTFVVDGETWVADPSAPPALEDDFGTPKSVVTVGGSHT